MTTNPDEGFPEDFVILQPGHPDEVIYQSGMVSLRGLGAHIGATQIVCMSPALAADLASEGFATPGQLASQANEIARTAVDTSKPGEPAGFLFAADTDLGKVWIEQFDTSAASIYYPSER